MNPKAKEFVEKLQKDKEMMLSLIGILIQDEIGYDFKSLQKIEQAIDDIYPFGHKPLVTTLLPFGFILGQTIINDFGGEWNYPEDKEEEQFDFFDLSVKIEDSKNGVFFIKPFTRVNKFWVHDRTDSLTAAYKMAEYVTSGLDFMDIDKHADEDGWVTMSDGYVVRKIQVEKEQIDLNK